MGKASRIKQQSAREKIAAQRAAAQKQERRNRILITGGSTLLVLVIVLVFVFVKLAQNNSNPSASSSSGRTPLPANVVSQVTNVPASALETVGKGSTSVSSTNMIPGSGAALTSGG